MDEFSYPRTTMQQAVMCLSGTPSGKNLSQQQSPSISCLKRLFQQINTTGMLTSLRQLTPNEWLTAMASKDLDISGAFQTTVLSQFRSSPARGAGWSCSQAYVIAQLLALPKPLPSPSFYRWTPKRVMEFSRNEHWPMPTPPPLLPRGHETRLWPAWVAQALPRPLDDLKTKWHLQAKVWPTWASLGGLR